MPEIGMKANDKLFHRDAGGVAAASPVSATWRIDTTTQQIKNAVVSALHECGLVERGPISVNERQEMAITTVLNVGRKASSILCARSIGSGKVTEADAGRAAQDLNAVLEALQKEFGL